MQSLSLFVILAAFLTSKAMASEPIPTPSELTSIVELVGTIVDAARTLEDLLLFLVLISALGVIVVVLHLWHQRDAVTLSLVVLLMTAVGVAAFYTRDARNRLESAPQSRLFLPLGESRQLGSFIIKLTDVDTLKTKIREGDVPPWDFNSTFGPEALGDFLRLGVARLETDFVAGAQAAFRWPTLREISEIASQGDADAWRRLMDRLEVDITNLTTERQVELKDAFSKWPLVRLTIRDAGSDRLILDRYFPDRSAIVFRDDAGRSFRLEIETVFNGDRDLGEAEACVLLIRSLDEEAAQQGAAADRPGRAALELGTQEATQSGLSHSLRRAGS